MQNLLPKQYTLLVATISSPLLLGVYEEDRLVEIFSSSKKISETFLPLLREILEKYPLSKTIYARGPGSYMAIKLTYIMLKTVEIVQDIPCYGCSAFALNGDKPIKAMGNLYFINEKETIMTQKYEQPVNAPFALPQSIHDLEIDEESTPEYVLPAV